MNVRLIGASSKIAYLTHQLNTSITKAAFSFSRDDRFHLNKRYYNDDRVFHRIDFMNVHHREVVDHVHLVLVEGL